MISNIRKKYHLVLLLFTALMFYEVNNVQAQNINKLIESVSNDSTNIVSFNEMIKMPSFLKLQIAIRESDINEVNDYLINNNVNKVGVCTLSLAYRDTNIEKFIEVHQLFTSAWKNKKIPSEVFSEFLYRCGLLVNGRFANIHRNPKIISILNDIVQENVNRNNELIWLHKDLIEYLRSGNWRRQLRAQSRVESKNNSLNVLSDSDEQAGYIGSARTIEIMKESPYPWYFFTIIIFIILIRLFTKRKWTYIFLSICSLLGFSVMGWLLSATTWILPI